jgi:hypothetical protein
VAVLEVPSYEWMVTVPFEGKPLGLATVSGWGRRWRLRGIRVLRVKMLAAYSRFVASVFIAGCSLHFVVAV